MLNHFGKSKIRFIIIIISAASIALLLIYPSWLGVSKEEIKWDDLRGANLLSPVLTTKEKSPTIGNWPANYEARSMKILADNKFNLVRVVMQWESFERDPASFLDEVEKIAATAETNGIKVIYDNHQWFISSQFDNDSNGFPYKVIASYHPTNPVNYETDPEIRRFWNDFWNNDIEVNGTKVWDSQIEYMGQVINRADKYSSVIGYEILNEPHVWDSSQYAKVGEYNTYIAKGLRQFTNKAIIFDRETAHGNFTRQVSLESLIVPRDVANIVYGPHLYSIPYPGSDAEGQAEQFVQWSKDWNVPVLIGEFSASSQPESDAFVSTWKTNGFGWTYWALGCFSCDESHRLVEKNMNSTPFFGYLKHSLDKYY